MEDNKNTNQNKTSLLTRLKETLENSLTRLRSTKIYKALPALIMSAIMAFTPITLSACNNPTDPTLPNNPDTEQGPGTNPGTDPSNPGTEDPYEGYSDLLKSVLTSDYYNTLISNANKNLDLYETAYFDPHPYSFLDKQGYDIAKIKDGELSCTTRAFVLDSEPNNLYIATYVETKATIPYYTEYMLKYTLTDEEMEDYDMLHDKKYIQAFFINDAISNKKTPTVVSQSRCTVEAHNGLQTNLEMLKSVKNLLDDNPLSTILFKDFDKNSGTFNVYIFSGLSPYNTIKYNRKMALIPLKEGSMLIENDDNETFMLPYVWSQFKLGDNFSSVISNSTTAYDSQYVSMLTIDYTFE